MKRKNCVKLLINYTVRNQSDDAELKELTPEDWDDIYNVSNQEGVVGYFYQKLKQKELDHLIPQEIHERFLQYMKFNLARNIVAFNELDKILESFNRKNIRVILLKGTHLLKFVYPSIGLRPIADLDLFIDRDNFVLANKILTEMGYKIQANLKNINPDFNEIYRENFQKAINYGSVNHRHHIDLHYKIFNQFEGLNLDEYMAGIWERTEEVKIGSHIARIMKPDDLILHLSHHYVYKHDFDILKYFIDLHLIIDKYQNSIDWDVLFNISKKYGMFKSLLITLNLQNHLQPCKFTSYPNIEEEIKAISNWKSGYCLSKIYEEKNKKSDGISFEVIEFFSRKIKSDGIITYIVKRENQILKNKRIHQPFILVPHYSSRLIRFVIRYFRIGLYILRNPRDRINLIRYKLWINDV